MMDMSRLAALKVAALHPKDRDWMLAQLSEAERDKLLGALSAISELSSASIRAMSELAEAFASPAADEESVDPVPFAQVLDDELSTTGAPLLELRDAFEPEAETPVTEEALEPDVNASNESTLTSVESSSESGGEDVIKDVIDPAVETTQEDTPKITPTDVLSQVEASDNVVGEPNINELDVKDVNRVLADMSEALVVAFLAMQRWDGVKQYLSSLKRGDRKRLQKAQAEQKELMTMKTALSVERYIVQKVRAFRQADRQQKAVSHG